MFARKASLNDLIEIFGIVDQYTHMYGIDIVTDGSKDRFKNRIKDILEKNEPNRNIVVSVDKDKITGLCGQIIGQDSWIVAFCFMQTKDYDPNNQFYGGYILEKMIELAEKSNIFKFYWVVREEKYSNVNKRLERVLSVTDKVNESYQFDTIEILPPYTKTKNERIAKYLLANFNGKNKKQIAIRHGFKK